MATPAPHSNREIQVFRDVADIASRAAELILAVANAAVQQNGRFTIALAGGSTPKTLYALLAAEPYFSVMPWEKTFIFFRRRAPRPTRRQRQQLPHGQRVHAQQTLAQARASSAHQNRKSRRRKSRARIRAAPHLVLQSLHRPASALRRHPHRHGR